MELLPGKPDACRELLWWLVSPQEQFVQCGGTFCPVLAAGEMPPPLHGPLVQAAISESVKLAVRDSNDDDAAEVAALLPPRQAEALERAGLTAQQRIWHVMHCFKERCKLLDRCAWR